MSAREGARVIGCDVQVGALDVETVGPLARGPGPARRGQKAGVIGMTKPLASEGAEHEIRVTALSPGFVKLPAIEPPPTLPSTTRIEPTRCGCISSAERGRVPISPI
jgi:NAD(P)-dependent dehydrogenase (short-subunit alcohol dehydrogenase family)